MAPKKKRMAPDPPTSVSPLSQVGAALSDPHYHPQSDKHTKDHDDSMSANLKDKSDTVTHSDLLVVRPKWTAELDLGGRPSPDFSQASVGHDSGVASDLDSCKNKLFSSSSCSSRTDDGSCSSNSSSSSDTDSIASSDTSVSVVSEAATHELSEAADVSLKPTRDSREGSCKSRLEEIQAIRGTLKKTKREFLCYDETCPSSSSGTGVSVDVQTFFLDENSNCYVDDIGTASVGAASADPMPSGSFMGVRVTVDGDEATAASSSETIRSNRGTVRGVKNRVRAGIATFQLKDSTQKTFAENERGRVVVYVTSLGIVREMLANCIKVRQIMRNLLVKIVEKDIFMSRAYQQELRQRMDQIHITNNSKSALSNNKSLLPAAAAADFLSVPQIFVEGQYLGNADAIEKLNEAGELRKMLRPFKCLSVTSVCGTCGGFGLLPCLICNGSKKSVHRNDFTEKFVALRCTVCDESALVKCVACSSS